MLPYTSLTGSVGMRCTDHLLFVYSIAPPGSMHLYANRQHDPVVTGFRLPDGSVKPVKILGSTGKVEDRKIIPAWRLRRSRLSPIWRFPILRKRKTPWLTFPGHPFPVGLYAP